jgi:SAM-dependent methyltransferase
VGIIDSGRGAEGLGARADRSWTIGGGPGFPLYRLYDALRRRLNRRLTAILLERGVARSAAVVLEVPSGPASGTSDLARSPRVAASIAVDIDLAALREGRRRDSTLRAVVADVYALPFRPGRVDVVWSSSSLEHLARPDAALAEMHRILRPSGRLFVGVPYRFGPLGFQPWIARSAAGLWIGPVFDRRALGALVTGQGFDILLTMTYFFRTFVGVLATKRVTGDRS